MYCTCRLALGDDDAAGAIDPMAMFVPAGSRTAPALGGALSGVSASLGGSLGATGDSPGLDGGGRKKRAPSSMAGLGRGPADPPTGVGGGRGRGGKR